MITAQQIADKLNSLGIDTLEKLEAFLAPALFASQLSQKRAALEKLREDHEAARVALQATSAEEVAALEAEIATINGQLQGV